MNKLTAGTAILALTLFAVFTGGRAPDSASPKTSGAASAPKEGSVIPRASMPTRSRFR